MRRMDARLVLVAAAAAALAACGPRAEQPPASVLSEAEKAGYLPAPVLTGVALGSGGDIVLHGRAAPQGRVRATTPAGVAYGATANAAGRFALELPVQAEPLLVAISAEAGERSTLAEGWLFAPPADLRRATLLRPGAPARVLDPAAPLIAAVDFDAAGGLAVAGVAPPNAEVRLFVDGAAVPPARSDAAGRYGFRLPRISPGPHRLRVESADRRQERALALDARPPEQQLSASRIAGGWRVDWATPGGGAQTTLIFDGGR